MGQNQTQRTVVAGVDGSECGLQAVRWAAAEALRRQLPLRLVAAHAWPSGGLVGDPGLGVDYRAVLRDVVLGHLATAAADARQVAPELDIEQVEVTGYPVPVLLGESAHAEIVVLGDRGLGGFTGLLIGSVAVEVTAHASCPVIVVRGSEPDRTGPRPEPVVVGVDGSPTSEAATAFAFEAASLRRVPLVAVHVWRDVLVDATMAPLLDWDVIDSDEREVLAERLAGWTEKYPDVPVRRLVARDRPARALVEESGRAQLVVVGSRGQALLHHAHCPVAVVRSPRGDEPPARA
jgi:nucleotide-binding universal stress UspA family protein